MFGIIFEGNRDLRRIYMPPDYTVVPAAQGLPAARRRGALAGRGRAPRRADRTQPAEMLRQPVLRQRRSWARPCRAPSRAARRQETEHGRMTDRAAAQSARSTIPNIFVETPATIFDAVPPYPPRTEREAEFYHLRDGEMLLNLGPQHPSTHGVLRVVLKIDGEQVVDLDPVLGYLHRGVEKICENGDWHHAISNCDPLEYIASMFSEAMPVLAAEKLLDLQVPRRAEYIRVLAWELNRIASHAPVHRLAGARPGRPDAAPVRLHRARRDRRDARRADRPAAALQLPAHRRRQPRPEPRLPVAPGRLDEPRRDSSSRTRRSCSTRTRSSSAARAAWACSTARRRCALCVTGPDTARDRRALRRPPRAPVQRLSGARLRHPDAHRGRLLRALHAPRRRDPREHPDHRPGAARDARRAGHGQAPAPDPRSRRVVPSSPSRARAASTRATRISDGSDQPFRLRIHDPSYFNLQAVGALMPGQPDRRHDGRSWPASTRSWAASTSERLAAASGWALTPRRGAALTPAPARSSCRFRCSWCAGSPSCCWSAGSCGLIPWLLEASAATRLGANIDIVRFILAATVDPADHRARRRS